MILKNVTDSFGRVRRHEYEVIFSQEERFWLDRHRCYTQNVTAETRKGSNVMAFTLYSGGSFIQIHCEPKDFFVNLEKEICRVPRGTIQVNATLPGMESDEEFE